MFTHRQHKLILCYIMYGVFDVKGDHFARFKYLLMNFTFSRNILTRHIIYKKNENTLANFGVQEPF